MKYLALSFFICLTFSGKAQDTLQMYYNKQWQKVSKRNAVFVRKAWEKEDGSWYVKNYLESGEKVSEGVFKSKRFKVKDGEFLFYYKNGSLRSRGNYLSDKKDGLWSMWAKNGQLVRKFTFKEGLPHGKCISWYENGNPDFEGYYAKGKLDKECSWYFRNGQLSAREVYDKGEEISLQFWNKDGSEVEKSKTKNSKPQFIGGPKSLLLYIGHSVKYPIELQKKKVQGRVVVRFEIDSVGNVQNAHVVKKDHPLFNREALRTVEAMPAWVPGKMHNRNTSIKYSVPINFRLQ